MSPEVESATRAVERASGVPVAVQADPSLKLIARVVVARNAAPAHVVLFNPGYGDAADYHVVSSAASSCGSSRPRPTGGSTWRRAMRAGGRWGDS